MTYGICDYGTRIVTCFSAFSEYTRRQLPNIVNIWLLLQVPAAKRQAAEGRKDLPLFCLGDKPLLLLAHPGIGKAGNRSGNSTRLPQERA
jgi:hypothetical protein